MVPCKVLHSSYHHDGVKFAIKNHVSVAKSRRITKTIDSRYEPGRVLQMIHRERLFPTPELLDSPRVHRAIEEMEQFYAVPYPHRKQIELKTRAHHILRKMTSEVALLFLGKCAFCEEWLGASKSMGIEHFRPNSNALGFGKDNSPDHYWWLTFDWQNLYPSCSDCNRTKGSRFPVHENRRASLKAGWDELRQEPAFLLDPCIDEPADHLVFSEDGLVAAKHISDLPPDELSRYGENHTRGQVTIDTFGLNRPSLVRRRKEEAERILGALESHPDLEVITRDFLAEEAPFLQMKRQLIVQHGSDEIFDKISSVSDEVAEVLDSTSNFRKSIKDVSTRMAAKEVHDRAFKQQTDYESAMGSTSVEVADSDEEYRARASYIEKVSIRGFTTMNDFVFDFSESMGGGEGASWLMLLGENGVGKSSVLKAIALALAGERRLRELEEDEAMGGLVNLFHEGGSVMVQLSSMTEPVGIRRVEGRLVSESRADGAHTFIRAFGPSRWFPTPNSMDPEQDDFVRVENLFNPFVPLESGEGYLAQLSDEQWDDVAFSLRRLLRLSDAGEIFRDGPDRTVMVRIPGDRPKRLRELSSGFEAVVAMAVDLIQMFLQRWPTVESSEGIVLLDEIGAHLHPRWRMQIVESLRATFPRVQFIATTHEPLCLRGLRQGEILLMERKQKLDGDEPGEETHDRAVTASRPVEDVSQLRIDQLLTSPLFGLHTTIEPELEKQFDRYYFLLSRHEDALDDEEKEELAQLTETVGSKGILGDTRRDQMIYQAIDSFLAREPQIERESERAEAEQLTEQQVVDFWSKIPDLPDDSTRPGGGVG